MTVGMEGERAALALCLLAAAVSSIIDARSSKVQREGKEVEGG